MTDTPEVIEPVVEPAKEAVEDVVPPPTPEPEPEPETEPEWRQAVHGLESKIDELAEKVASMLPAPAADVIEPDEKPIKKPWTHRNPFSKD